MMTRYRTLTSRLQLNFAETMDIYTTKKPLLRGRAKLKKTPAQGSTVLKTAPVLFSFLLFVKRCFHSITQVHQLTLLVMLLQQFSGVCNRKTTCWFKMNFLRAYLHLGFHAELSPWPHLWMQFKATQLPWGLNKSWFRAMRAV